MNEMNTLWINIMKKSTWHRGLQMGTLIVIGCGRVHVCMCVCAWGEEECVLGWGACAAVVTRHYGVECFILWTACLQGPELRMMEHCWVWPGAPQKTKKCTNNLTHTQYTWEQAVLGNRLRHLPTQYANTTIYAHTESVHHCASYMRTHCI